MSKLIAKHKSIREDRSRDNCGELTNIMKRIVDNQEDRNEFFETGFIFKKPVWYNTSCAEFRKFSDEVNNDPNNKIFIERDKKPYVNYIHTQVDIANEKVTYTLGHYDRNTY